MDPIARGTNKQLTSFRTLYSYSGGWVLWIEVNATVKAWRACLAQEIRCNKFGEGGIPTNSIVHQILSLPHLISHHTCSHLSSSLSTIFSSNGQIHHYHGHNWTWTCQFGLSLVDLLAYMNFYHYLMFFKWVSISSSLCFCLFLRFMVIVM